MNERKNERTKSKVRTISVCLRSASNSTTTAGC